jgi:hypothetical protein
MSDFRRWLQERIARLDGTRERRAIAFGSMGLLAVLIAGPWMLRGAHLVSSATASAFTRKPRIARRVEVPPRLYAAFATASAEPPAAAPPPAKSVAAADPSPPSPPPPKDMPSLALALPIEGAASARPVELAAHLQGAAVVDVIFELRDASGSARGIEAAPAGADGIWDALFDGDPGGYELSVRASLANGYVQEFPERRHFTIVDDVASHSAGESPAPDVAKPSPQVVLLAPTEGSATFQDSAPLTATVKAGLAERVSFVVTAADAGQVIVLGKKWPGGDYWSGLFEGADGTYTIQARADIEGDEILSDPRSFSLKHPKARP